MGISQEHAERLIESRLRDLERTLEQKDLVIDRESVREYVWGWLIPYGTRLWVEGKDPAGMLLGGGPFCVARDTATVEALHHGHSARRVNAQVRQFERRIGFRAWWRFW
jgi:hypothetical protein